MSLECDPSSAILRLPPSREGLEVQHGYKATSLAMNWWFEPGVKRIRATADGHVSKDLEIRIESKTGVETVSIVLDPVPTKTAATPTRAPTKFIVNTQPVVVPVVDVSRIRNPGPNRALEWTLIATGLAVGAAGGALYTAGYFENESLYKKYNDSKVYPDPDDAWAAYRNARKQKIEPMEISAYALFGVGGAALASGVITYFVRKPQNTRRATGPAISPMVVPGGTGATMTIEF